MSELKPNGDRLLASFAKGREGAQERVDVAVRQYQGHRYLDLRLHVLVGSDWTPTKKGVTLKLSDLPALIDALRAVVE